MGGRERETEKGKRRVGQAKQEAAGTAGAVLSTHSNACCCAAPDHGGLIRNELLKGGYERRLHIVTTAPTRQPVGLCNQPARRAARHPLAARHEALHHRRDVANHRLRAHRRHELHD